MQRAVPKHLPPAVVRPLRSRAQPHGEPHSQALAGVLAHVHLAGGEPLQLRLWERRQPLDGDQQHGGSRREAEARCELLVHVGNKMGGDLDGRLGHVPA